MSFRDEMALKDYVDHINQAIDRIQRYLQAVDHSGFLVNEEKQDAVIRNLEIIGEAAGNIQRHFPDFGKKHPELPLKAAYRTRNALSHGYFKIDLDVVWRTCERDLPKLKVQLQETLNSLTHNGSSSS